MIVKMQKARMVVLEKQKESFLTELRKIGIVHLNYTATEKVISHQTETIAHELKEEEDFILRLKTYGKLGTQEELSLEKSDEASKKAKATQKKIDALKSEKSLLESEIFRVEPLGNFSIENIELAKRNGVNLTLYSIAKNEMKNIPSNTKYITCVDGKEKNIIACINTTLKDKEVFKMPDDNLDNLKKRLSNINSEIEKLIQEMVSNLKYISSFGKKTLQLQERLEYSQAKDNLLKQKDVEVCVITGFVPKESTDLLKKICQTNGYGLILEEVNDDDYVPTLLKNNAISSLIRPVLKFIDIMPGYKELDISIWFLIFFTIFTGILIGDAGYGSVLLIASIGMMIALKPNLTSILFVILSLATIVWGAITGSWFGMDYDVLVNHFPIAKNFMIYAISSQNPDSTITIQTICFILAIVHLTIAHVSAFFKKIVQKPHIHAFTELGKLGIVWGIFDLVLHLVIGPKYPILPAALYGIIVGFIIVFIFSSQESGKNFFKALIDSLANIIGLLLDVIASFSDIVSYIRLYAVGAAGYAMANSFNSMVAGSGPIGYVVLIFAHGLVLLLCLLSVLVHGIRLNTLEFSLHLGNEWSGFAYNPFKKKLI